jgi:hypothetical protein
MASNAKAAAIFMLVLCTALHFAVSISKSLIRQCAKTFADHSLVCGLSALCKCRANSSALCEQHNCAQNL